MLFDNDNDNLDMRCAKEQKGLLHRGALSPKPNQKKIIILVSDLLSN
jgi:hypothetical protein